MTTDTRQYAEVLTTPGFSGEAVEAVADFCGDASWLREQRLAAWAAYERIPMPTSRDEHWRFTNMRRVKTDGVLPFTGCENKDEAFAAAAGAMTAAADFAARFVAVNNAIWEGSTTVNELPKGVIVGELGWAAREYPELVGKHYGSAVPVSDSVNDKFVALNGALSPSGVFVYVPRNVTVDLPIEYVISHAVDGGTMMPRVLLVLEENAEATFVEEYLSADAELTGFSNAVVELVVGDGARLHYITAQNYALGVTHFATHRVIAGRDAQVDWTAVGLGASLGKTRMEVRLVGAGANVKLTGAYFLDGRQQLDYDTQQFHEAPNAYSDLSFRGVLTDKAKSVWRGMIDVAEGAQGTDSYQENRNLLLSPEAHADSIPGLQIEANEVRCTHGATISKVDAEQLFYLQARGLSKEVATRTIVRGFFVPALDRIANEATRESVRVALWERMDAATDTNAD